MGWYLSVYRKVGLPGLRGDDLADAVLRGLGGNLLHVLEGVLKFLLGRSVGRGLLQAVRADPLAGLAAGGGLPPPLDTGHVEGRRVHGTEGERRGGGIVRIGRGARLASSGGVGVGATSGRGSHGGGARGRGGHGDLDHGEGGWTEDEEG
jgi:hypothetical protein